MIEENLLTCPRCCSPNIELRNPHTYNCLFCNHTFNIASLGRGVWVDADRVLRRTELLQGPVAELRAQPRPLNHDGAARIAWVTGNRYEFLPNGRTKLWVQDCCDSPCCTTPPSIAEPPL